MPLRSKIPPRRAAFAGVTFAVLFAMIGYNVVLDTRAATTPASADIDNSGSVNIFDLSAVLAAWGAIGANPADVDGNQVVNIFDVSGVLAHWTKVASTPTVSVTPPPTTDSPLPPTPTPTGTSVIPASAKVVFRGDYETGDFSQWTNVENVGQPWSAAIVGGGQQRSGKYAVRFEVRPGEKPFPGPDRSEVSKYGAAKVFEGDERWYQFSMKPDATFHNPTSPWFIVMQWHSGSGSPPMNLNISRAGVLQLLNNATNANPKDIGPIRKGVWTDYIIHVKFSNDPNIGWAEVYENGQLVLPRHNRANMSSSQNYFKEGMYMRTQTSGPEILFYDGPIVYAP